MPFLGSIFKKAGAGATRVAEEEVMDLPQSQRVFGPGRPDDLGFITSGERALTQLPKKFADAKALTADQWRSALRAGGTSNEGFTYQLDPALASFEPGRKITRAELEEAMARNRETLGSADQWIPKPKKKGRDNLEPLIPQDGYDQYVAPGRADNYQQETLTSPTAAREGYRSHNWNTDGVVAHVRTTQRQTASGEKVMHVEELQSDLHQEGAKYGYRGNAERERFSESYNRLKDRAAEARSQYEAWANSRPQNEATLPAFSPASWTDRQLELIQDATGRELARTLRYADQRLIDAGEASRNSSRTPPRAPMEDWEGPLVQRALLKAAEAGNDLVTFPTHSTLHTALQNEGTKKFYDERLPRTLERIAKALGAKVERVDIGPDEAAGSWKVKPGSNGYQIYSSRDGRTLIAPDAAEAQRMVDHLNSKQRLVPAIRITPEAKKRLTQGVVMYGAPVMATASLFMTEDAEASPAQQAFTGGARATIPPPGETQPVQFDGYIPKSVRQGQWSSFEPTAVEMTGEAIAAQEQSVAAEASPEAPKFWEETVPAAFRRENVIGSAMVDRRIRDERARKAVARGEIQRFNPFDGDYLGEEFEPYADRFVGLVTRAEADAMKAQIGQEREDAQILALSGLPGLGAQFVAGALDPTIFIPIGGSIKKGDSLLRMTWKGVLGGAGGAGLSEALLHQSQELRTNEESILAVTAGGFLGGIIGSGHRLFLKDNPKVATQLADDLTIKGEDDPMFAADVADRRAMQSAGAAAVPVDLSLDTYGVADAFGLDKVTGAIGLNPIMRIANSRSPKAREVGALLMENGMFLARNSEGKASPLAVETAMTEYRGWEAEALSGYRKTYKEMRKAGIGMTKREFAESVGQALRRGDVGDNEFITRAAGQWRQALEKTKQRAIEMRLLPEDVKPETADSYFHRMWNRKVLEARPEDFRAMTRQWLTEQFDGIMARAAAIREDLAKLEAKAGAEDQKILDQADELEEMLRIEGDLDGLADTVARDIFNTLTGNTGRAQPMRFAMVPNARGPLKERTFHIPDLYATDRAAVEDFLVDDVEEVMSRYMRVMSADIEIARAFGDPDMSETLKAVREDFDRLAEGMTGEAQKQAVANQKRKAIRDLEGVRDILRGQFGSPANHENMWVRGAAWVRTWNYMTLLGGMTVSAFPDVANKVLSNGFFGITRDLMVPLLTDLKGIKVAAREAKAYGIAVEGALASRIAAMADIGSPYARGTSFERATDAVGNTFSTVTGMRLWNDVMKTADYIMAQNRAIRILTSESPSKKQSRWLAWAGVGLDDPMAGRIRAQIDKYGSTDRGMKLANMDEWDDAEAARIFKGVMAKEASTVTVTPGAGDKLLMSHTEVGKTILQFKSFAFAAHQRVTMRALQQGRELDGNLASFFVSSMTLGMLVYWLKMEDSLRETSDDPVVWAREGLDRSGMMPLLFETLNTAEKMTGKTFVGEAPASRYASRGAFAALLGPSVGRGEDVMGLVRGMADGNLKDTDIHAVRKLLPYNNLVLFRRLLDDLEMDIVEATGAEETQFSANRKAAMAN